MTHPPSRPPRRARLYHQVRSAHLERAAQLPPARLLYGSRRYDFQEDLADGLDLVPAPGARAAWHLLRHGADVLEVNEPLYLHGARWTALALLGLRVGEVVRRRRGLVVSYAIENLDPAGLRPSKGLRSRVGRRLDALSMRAVWRRLDRVAFGTSAARDLYASVLGRRPGQRSTVIPALPAPAADVRPQDKEPGTALFLGAFSARKGLPQVAAAWPAVAARLPEARLTLVGKGALEPVASGLAEEQTQVQLVVDPPRAEIREHLQRHTVLVLPAQPTPGWREQVGLPLVEGLSYGCTVVTTAETGLAEWLAAHGHRVVEPAESVGALVEALVAALEHPLDPVEVLGSLPDNDGRLAADAWLFDDPVPVGTRGSGRGVGADVA